MTPNPIRISRCLHDYVSAKERLLFTRRRWNWKPLMIALTILAAAIFYAIPFAFGAQTSEERRWGRTSNGMAFVVEHNVSKDGVLLLINFTVYISNERG